MQSGPLEVLHSRLTASNRALVETQQVDMSSYRLPKANLVVASFSLPFVGQEKLLSTWASIREAILPGGRFAGHFFGTSEPMVLNGMAAGVERATLREMFRGFEIEFFEEQLCRGPACGGPDKIWHTYSVVARRLDTQPTVSSAPLFVYHFVPSAIAGEHLMPLNLMRNQLPEVYASEVSKYTGREIAMEQFVHGLDCKWNHVLHFLPFHPRHMRAAFEGLGAKWPGGDTFEVDPSAVGMDASNTTIFKVDCFRRPDETTLREEFTPFSLDEMRLVQNLPAFTREYYRGALSKGERPLIAQWVPHILFRGTIPQLSRLIGE